MIRYFKIPHIVVFSPTKIKQGNDGSDALRMAVLGLGLCAVLLLASATSLYSWGFWGHKEINKRAIVLLPFTVRTFFETHASFISDHAVDPDLRRGRGDSLEPYNHYLDIDYYGRYPFSALPRNLDSAIAKFGTDTVRHLGVLPWRIAAFTDSLSAAMRRGNQADILAFAAELGHYAGDSYVPLHAVIDYDGVARNQRGVHSRWESSLAEKYKSSYHYPIEGCRYIEDPLKYAFETILESYTFADSVFASDLRALHSDPHAKTFKRINRNGDSVFVYSNAYYGAFRKHDGNLLEHRLRGAIISLASYWYTAWVKAGKPELP